MSFKALVTSLFIVTVLLLGMPSFAACRQNGGGLAPCGLIGFMVGGLKTVLLATIWFVALLINGMVHLFAGG